MPNTLLNRVSGLLGLGGVSRILPDFAMSSGSLSSVFGASGIVSAGQTVGGVFYAATNLPGAAAIIDFGANVFTRGMFKLRIKSFAGVTTNAVLALVVAQDSAFATAKRAVAVFGPISFVAGFAQVEQTFTDEFDADPTPFRYARIDNVGTALGATPITMDLEVVALP